MSTFLHCQQIYPPSNEYLSCLLWISEPTDSLHGQPVSTHLLGWPLVALATPQTFLHSLVSLSFHTQPAHHFFLFDCWRSSSKFCSTTWKSTSFHIKGTHPLVVSSCHHGRCKQSLSGVPTVTSFKIKQICYTEAYPTFKSIREIHKTIQVIRLNRWLYLDAYHVIRQSPPGNFRTDFKPCFWCNFRVRTG